MPSHHLNQCWHIVNWALCSKLQWNLNQNMKTCIEENALENVGCKMASIFSQSQYVNSLKPGDTSMHQWTGSSLVKIMDCFLFHYNDVIMGAKASQIINLTIVYSIVYSDAELRVTGLCARNSPGTGEFPAQMASYAENASIWWRHHVYANHYWCQSLLPRHKLIIEKVQC